jgi:hypothetical protein
MSGCDPMHGKPLGVSMKAPDGGSAGCIPGCRDCHNEQTEIGWPAFEEKHRFSREEAAREWWARFLEKEGKRNVSEGRQEER